MKPGRSDVFIYYSGHGAPETAGGKAYLLPTDCDPKRVSLNGYPLDLVYRNVAELPARSTTIVIDSCFSGASHRGTLIPGLSPVLPVIENPLLEAGQATVLTASRGDEVSGWYPDHMSSDWLCSRRPTETAETHPTGRVRSSGYVTGGVSATVARRSRLRAVPPWRCAAARAR